MTVTNDVDEKALRRCLGQFGTGVAVITALVGGKRFGVTVNSFSSLSLNPPLVLWSIKKTSRSFSAFCKAEHFAVNILSAEQIAISRAFSGAEDDKFIGLSLGEGITGTPVISGTIAVLECQTEARHDGGDHVIFIGRVIHFAHRQGDALLFSQGRYAIAVDHPEASGRGS